MSSYASSSSSSSTEEYDLDALDTNIAPSDSLSSEQILIADSNSAPNSPHAPAIIGELSDSSTNHSDVEKVKKAMSLRRGEASVNHSSKSSSSSSSSSDGSESDDAPMPSTMSPAQRAEIGNENSSL